MSRDNWNAVDTPLGTLTFMTSPRGLVALRFEDRPQGESAPTERGSEADDAHDIATRLRGYFQGELDALDPIALDVSGTRFQQRVWALVRAIPPGHTRSYGDLAGELAQPGAARAVGAANAHNPVALVVPCHRVIGANGQLTGYAYGTARKRWLLEHESMLRSVPRRADDRLLHLQHAKRTQGGDRAGGDGAGLHGQADPSSATRTA